MQGDQVNGTPSSARERICLEELAEARRRIRDLQSDITQRTREARDARAAQQEQDSDWMLMVIENTLLQSRLTEGTETLERARANNERS